MLSDNWSCKPISGLLFKGSLKTGFTVFSMTRVKTKMYLILYMYVFFLFYSYKKKLVEMTKMNMKHLVSLTILMILMKFSQQCPTTMCPCSDENGRKIINCRSRSLTVIPTFTPDGVTYDEITFASGDRTGCASCNKISVVGVGAFSNLRVKKIILTQTAVRTFSINAFAGLEDILEGLELEGDGSNPPPYGEITSLSKLQLLHFENFMQTSMTKGNTLPSPFPQLKELRFVNFGNLQTIASDAFLYGIDNQKKFPLLSTFILRIAPGITTLPVPLIQRQTDLEHLEISDTGISEIGGLSFSPLTKLLNLHITFNSYLSTIRTGAFDGISNTLEFLYLGHNNLQNLDSLGTNWGRLQQLNLQNNPLETIAGSPFSQMGQLEYLNFDYCKLTSIDSSVLNGLSNLHTLVLSNNDLRNLPDGVFQNTPELKELKLNDQDNPITLSENVFQGIETSLNHLFISDNSISVSIFWSLIEKLPNLYQLHASQLNLNTISDKAFKNNIKLNYVDLANNSISVIQESAFYRLRDSLVTLSLSHNSIESISKCVFPGFAFLKNFFLQHNPLKCDCRIQWLHDWIFSIQNINERIRASVFLGVCDTPPALTGSNLHEISSSDLTCTAGYVEPMCTDLYATTTKPSTTTSTSTTPSPSDIVPTFSFTFGVVTDTSIQISWTVSDKTYVSGYFLEYTSDILKNKTIHKDLETDTVHDLNPQTYYTFCLYLKLNGQLYRGKSDCQFERTLKQQVTTSTTVATTPEPEANIGIIAGAAVGGIAFVAIVIFIVVILIRYKKPPKKQIPPTTGVSFIPAPGGTLPQAGGTAKRFAKPKDGKGKDGAVDPDEIQIQTISNGGLDGTDRFSAGSYQLLNEKDFHRGPMPSTSKGHYVNDLDERPLPQTPYGAPGPSGGKSRGYVNTGFKGSAEQLPETSKNTYNELYVPGTKKK